MERILKVKVKNTFNHIISNSNLVFIILEKGENLIVTEVEEIKDYYILINYAPYHEKIKLSKDLFEVVGELSSD